LCCARAWDHIICQIIKFMGAILLTTIHLVRRLLFVQTRRQCMQIWVGRIYKPNNQIHGSNTSHNQETPLRANMLTVHLDLSGKDGDQFLRTGHIKTYDNCSNLLSRTKKNIGRHLSWQQKWVSFQRCSEGLLGSVCQELPIGTDVVCDPCLLFQPPTLHDHGGFYWLVVQFSGHFVW